MDPTPRARTTSRGPARVDLHDLRVASVALLGAAAVLPSGHGTGLPCAFRTVTGVPCPLCGLTGSVTATVHGDIALAVARNPAGLAVVAAAVAVLLARRSSIAVPRGLPWVGVLALWVCSLLSVR